MNRPIVLNNSYTTLERKVVQCAFEKLPRINPKNKSRHVSIITLGKYIIEYGLNDERGYLNNRPFGYERIHSEFAVIKKFLSNHFSGQLNQYTLWNVRINRYNEIVNSRPCKRCQYFLGIFAPKRVIFSNEKGEFQWLN